MRNPLSRRLYSDEAYIAVARAVRYHQLPTNEIVDKLQDDLKKHGREKMDEAARALLDVENGMAKLKADVRKYCRQLLGPLPEEWDEFYAGVTNPPPNPYKPTEKEEPLAVPQSNVAADMSSEALIRKLSNLELLKLRDECVWAIKHHVKSRKASSFKKALARVDAEMKHRGMEDEPTIDHVAEHVAGIMEEETAMNVVVAHPQEIEKLAKLTTRRLKELLDMDQIEMAKYGPETVTHQEAAREIGLIEAELARRQGPRTRYAIWSEAGLQASLQRARERYSTFSPNTKEWKEASETIDELEIEFRRRGLTMPVSMAAKNTTRKPKKTR